MNAYVLAAVVLPGIFWPHDSAGVAALRSIPGIRIHDTQQEVVSWMKVPAPRLENRTDVAAATTVPWIDANGWRFRRGLRKAFYSELPAGSAPLAAAEAHAYGVEAVLAPSPEDLPALSAMLRFLLSVGEVRLPVRANIGVVDDQSPLLGEALNLLSRRNLLYTVIAEPDARLDVNVRVGTKKYPRKSLANPSEFAARVRAELGDERRLLRIFNTYTVLGHLTGDSSRARLYLINYSPRPAKDVHVRVRGSYTRAKLADSHVPSMEAADASRHQGGMEFTVPQIHTYTVVDLEK